MHKRDKKHHMTNQVKSRKRVVDHGEVFTAEREVKAMCDLVSDECLRIDSRFLEPACGNGNFLSEILARKLDEVAKKYKRSPADYEKNALLALGSLYGVELLLDNVKECRYRFIGCLLFGMRSTAVPSKRKTEKKVCEPLSAIF